MVAWQPACGVGDRQALRDKIKFFSTQDIDMFGFVFTTVVTALSLLVVDLTVPGVGLATFGAAIAAASALRRRSTSLARAPVS